MPSEASGQAVGQLIEELAELTVALEQAIEDGDWDRAAQVESRRRDSAGRCFSCESLEPGQVERLKQISQASRDLVLLVRSARDQAARESGELQRGRAAVNDYADVGMGSLD